MSESRTKALGGSQSGFTLIELLIYSVLIVIMMSTAITTIYQITDSSDAINKKVAIEEEANFILRKIQWVLTGVELVISPAPNTTNADTLSIDKYNFGLNPINVTSGSGNITIQKQITGPLIPLNSENVEITSLEFDHIASSGTKPAGIETRLGINGKIYTMLIHLKK